MSIITRRQFLRHAATSSAGGLLLGFHIPAVVADGLIGPEEGPAVAGHAAINNGADGEINAWLVIDPDDTITIRVAQSEMGQGVMTALPMIIAEELEADWRQVKTEYADANRNLKQGQVYGRMLTEGSSAVRHSRQYLQMAGAEARERLIKAAAERWNVSVADCYADYGRVYHDAGGRSINYGAIAADAAGLNVANVQIRKPEDFKLIGLPTPRLDVPSKVDGSAVFGIDIRLPEMVYAAVIHAPVLGARLRSYRFNAVRNRPGILKSVRLDNGIAIIAEHYWQAKSAIDAMPIEWQPSPASKAHSDGMVREFVSALDEPGTVVEEFGRPEALMDEAETTIESDYVLPYLAHACLEPLNCTVHIQADRVDVWAGLQNPEAALQVTARVSGRPAEQVFIHNCLLGGGFGRRSHMDYVEEAVKIAAAVKRPVQMIWSREEDQRQGRYRPMSAMRFKAGFDLDKNLIAYTNHSVTHSILKEINPAIVSNGVDKVSLEGLVKMPYRLTDRKISHTIRNTHLTSWFWRSVGHSQNAFAVECFIDEMATAAGRDPFDYRRELLSDQPAFIDVLLKLKAESGWGRRMPRASAQGVAIHECFGTICGQVVDVTVTPDGGLTIDKVVSVVDCGNLVNPLTAEAQVESAIIFGLTAALYGKLTVENGKIVEDNFDSYLLLRMDETPVMETHFIPATGDQWGGLGEPGTPPIAPAVCNALYKITGRRLRTLPIREYYLQPA